MAVQKKNAGKPQAKKAAQPKKPAKAVKAAAGIKTWLGFILDKSGSMGVQREAAISGFNEFLSEQKKVVDDTTLTLTLFDSDVHTLYTGKALEDCADLTEKDYVPGGNTALYDAIMKTSMEIEKLIGKGDRVIITVFTDGQENASRELTSAKALADFIKEREKRGNWTFAYLGSARDAWNSAVGMGFTGSNVGVIDPSNVKGGTVAMGMSIRGMRGSMVMSYSPTGSEGGIYNVSSDHLTDEDKEKLLQNVSSGPITK